jgi:methionine salvage enolase-phosphatase E1
MIGTEQTPMFEELPVYPEDLEKAKNKKPKVNNLQEIVIELMNERGLKDVDVVKATGIPWGTWMGWINGEVKAQLADDNLKKLMQYFNVHLEYLVYGIGTDEPAFKEFDGETA